VDLVIVIRVLKLTRAPMCLERSRAALSEIFILYNKVP